MLIALTSNERLFEILWFDSAKTKLVAPKSGGEGGGAACRSLSAIFIWSVINKAVRRFVRLARQFITQYELIKLLFILIE